MARIRWIKIRQFERGLLFRDKQFSGVLRPGRHLFLDPLWRVKVDVVSVRKRDGAQKEYALVSSARQVEWKRVAYAAVDQIPNTWMYRRRTELGQRLRAHRCEWCGTQEGPIEVHHVRKLKDLKGKELWKRQMIARRRKTMVLCKRCHVKLHAGKLGPKTLRKNWRAGHLETCTSGSEGSSVKPSVATR